LIVKSLNPKNDKAVQKEKIEVKKEKQVVSVDDGHSDHDLEEHNPFHSVEMADTIERDKAEAIELGLSQEED